MCRRPLITVLLFPVDTNVKPLQDKRKIIDFKILAIISSIYRYNKQVFLFQYLDIGSNKIRIINISLCLILFTVYSCLNERDISLFWIRGERLMEKFYILNGI